MATQDKNACTFSIDKDLPPLQTAPLLEQVESLLKEDRVQAALALIGRAESTSPWLRNAAGVCQLRLGNASLAVDVFKGLVVASGGFGLRPEAPTVFKTNFATALLLTDNLGGFQSVLEELRADDHPALNRLRDSYRRWKGSLTFWQRIRFTLGGQPAAFALDFPPGEIS